MLKKFYILKRTNTRKTEYLSERWREGYLTLDEEEARRFNSIEEIEQAFTKDGETEFPSFAFNEFEIITKITFKDKDDE